MSLYELAETCSHSSVMRRFESYLGGQIGRRSLESAPAAFFLCQVVFVTASRSNGWRNVAVRVWSFHIEFEHTKLSNFRFSLESCCLYRK